MQDVVKQTGFRDCGGKMSKTEVPVARIIKLLAKVLRFRKDGLSPAERQELLIDLLVLVGDVADDASDR